MPDPAPFSLSTLVDRCTPDEIRELISWLSARLDAEPEPMSQRVSFRCPPRRSTAAAALGDRLTFVASDIDGAYIEADKVEDFEGEYPLYSDPELSNFLGHVDARCIQPVRESDPEPEPEPEPAPKPRTPRPGDRVIAISVGRTGRLLRRTRWEGEVEVAFDAGPLGAWRIADLVAYEPLTELPPDGTLVVVLDAGTSSMAVPPGTMGASHADWPSMALEGFPGSWGDPSQFGSVLTD